MPVVSPIRAETVVVPNSNESTSGAGAGLTLPFSASESRWQQVYGSGEFNSAGGNLLQINQLRFRIDEERPVGSSFSTVTHGLSIFMASTTRTFSTASATYDENIEGNLFQVLPMTDVNFTGVRSSATSFDVVIPLPNAYVYDRTSGNLLVDIRVAGTSVLPPLDQTGRPNSTYSVGGSLSFPDGTLTSQGLVTQFGFTIVPESRPIILLMIGAALILMRKNGDRG
jgi:hypothetical protein